MKLPFATSRIRRHVVCTVAAFALWASGATAWARDGDDHERARQAVQAGQVLPLRTVLERLEREHPGQVLEVELERDGERWLYEIKLLQADGRLFKLVLDARTAEVLRSKSRDHNGSGGRRPPR
jgi:uncharacterized membrane protein YkoI